MLLNAIYYGSDADGKIPKTKLAKLLYLIDFISYYEQSSSISNLEYRKLPLGPVPYEYFEILDELKNNDFI
jgi:hypothetical protein